jgi:hypothetical protein
VFGLIADGLAILKDRLEWRRLHKNDYYKCGGTDD